MFYELVLLVHIGASVALLGGSVIASPGVRAAVVRAQTVQDVRAYLAIGRPLLTLEPVSAVVVLASGIYLTDVAGFWRQGWVQVAVAFWTVNAVVAGLFVKPAIDRVKSEAASAAGAVVEPELDELRRSRRWAFGSAALMANDVAMLYLMTMKPSLPGSLIAVAVANLAAATFVALR